jgi:signal transduction histidine kinase
MSEGASAVDRGENRAAARVSVAAGLGVAAVGAFVLCGWALNVETFKTIYGPITMKTNMAIGLLLCGVSLAVVRQSPRVAGFCAVAAGLIGGLTLSQHLVGWNLGIDELLFTEAPGAAATVSPNRMGLTGATCLVLGGVSLYHLRRGDARGAAVAQALAAVALSIASIPIAGYLYGAEELYGIARYTGIALHTAIALILLNAGILTARATLGPVAVFLDDGPAGTMLRRLALPIVGIPLALGYLEISARSAQIVDRGLGIALYAISLIVVLGGTVWLTAQVIERSDRARRRAELDRDLLMVSERHARAEAERASRLKDHFLATLSHELRTPLNVMLGWTRMLELGASPRDHLRIVGLVAKNGRLLARLVEDLLDLSRVTAGQFEISRAPTLLNAVVQSSFEALGPMASGKGVALAAELDPEIEPIDADPERLQQIAWNLLSNAVKFTAAGGRIVARTTRTPDAAVLIISDTGVGFDQAFAADLFKPFRQADSSVSREHGGLGLGLSIARHLAELHNGTLTGTSDGIGHGATFTLTLPRAGSPGPGGPTTVTPAAAASEIGADPVQPLTRR